MDTWRENIERWRNLAHAMWSCVPEHLFVRLEASLLFSLHISKESLATNSWRGDQTTSLDELMHYN